MISRTTARLTISSTLSPGRGWWRVQLWLCALIVLPVHAATSPSALLLEGGKVYAAPSAPPIFVDVLVRGDSIVDRWPHGERAIPSDATVLDCRGLVITSGFQNSHVHLMTPRLAEAASATSAQLTDELTAMFTRFGFTTVVDTGSMIDNTIALRERIRLGDVDGPRILTAGSPLYPPAGIPIYLRDLPPEILARLPQPSAPSEAVAIVRANHDAGADVIKLFTGSVMGGGVVKPMPLDIATAAVAEAHRLGMSVFAHPTDMVGAQVAIEAGVDVLAHTNSEGWDESLIDRTIAKRMALVPTLQLWLFEAARQHASDAKAEAFVRNGIDELAAFHAAGGRVLFGTDVGYMTDYDPTAEYQLMARAKLSASDILASLTTSPVAQSGESKRRGEVATGFAADLVVLEGDPLDDIANFARVRYTIRGGRVIYRATPPLSP